MEVIKDFEVEIDISDRKVLYDYGREEYIYRQEKGEWDYAALKERAGDSHLSAEDENKLVRIRNMDGAIANFRFMEKDKEKGKSKEKKEEEKGDYTLFSTFNTLQGSQVVPRRVLPVYLPGEIVHGKVILELKDKLEAESFSISFKGKADVRIRVYHGRGFYDDYGKERYVNEEVTVWQKADGKSDVSDKFSLLSLGNVSTSEFLPAGRHEFTFDFAIPQDARHSTPSLMESYCDYGYIAYRIKATIEKGKRLGRGNIAVCRGLWVNKALDVSEMPAELKQSATIEEKVDTGLFGGSGHTLLSVTIPRKVYARGEVIPVTLIMDNACDTPIKSISTFVKLAGKVRSSRGALRPSRSVNVKSVKRKEGPVKAKDYQRYTFDLPLDFSESIIDSNLIPVGTLDECDLIDVKYEVVVTVKRKSLHRNLEAKVPITICTTNSEAKK